MEVQERAIEVLKRLKKAYPDAPITYLKASTPFEMLIATILSANTTDASVNKSTPDLFAKYPDARSLMSAPTEDLIALVHDTGAYNKKAGYIKETARMIVEEFGGDVPSTIPELVKFPGVSRKTANVVLQVSFGINEGVVVDTHIMRVTQRLALSQQKNREKIESELMAILPKKDWSHYARLVGAHGRRLCKARGPKCDACSVNDLCPSAEL
jgi:endonuclease-3